MKRNEFLDKLSEVLEYKEQALTEKSDLTEIWDSMGQIDVISLLDDEFDVTLELEELDAIITVQDILNILASRKITLE